MLSSQFNLCQSNNLFNPPNITMIVHQSLFAISNTRDELAFMVDYTLRNPNQETWVNPSKIAPTTNNNWRCSLTQEPKWNTLSAEVQAHIRSEQSAELRTGFLCFNSQKTPENIVTALTIIHWLYIYIYIYIILIQPHNSNAHDVDIVPDRILALNICYNTKLCKMHNHVLNFNIFTMSIQCQNIWPLTSRTLYSSNNAGCNGRVAEIGHRRHRYVFLLGVST